MCECMCIDLFLYLHLYSSVTLVNMRKIQQRSWGAFIKSTQVCLFVCCHHSYHHTDMFLILSELWLDAVHISARAAACVPVTTRPIPRRDQMTQLGVFLHVWHDAGPWLARLVVASPHGRAAGQGVSLRLRPSTHPLPSSLISSCCPPSFLAYC